MTDLGQLMAEFPLDPMLTKMLVSSVDFDCSYQVLTLVSMLSVPYCYHRPRVDLQLIDRVNRVKLMTKFPNLFMKMEII